MLIVDNLERDIMCYRKITQTQNLFRTQVWIGNLFDHTDKKTRMYRSLFLCCRQDQVHVVKTSTMWTIDLLPNIPKENTP